MKYQWIKQHRDEFSIQLMCRALAVSRSAFYQWMKAPTRIRQAYRETLAKEIRLIRSERFMDSYGSPRMTEELNARGTAVCRH